MATLTRSLALRQRHAVERLVNASVFALLVDYHMLNSIQCLDRTFSKTWDSVRRRRCNTHHNTNKLSHPSISTSLSALSIA